MPALLTTRRKSQRPSDWCVRPNNLRERADVDSRSGPLKSLFKTPKFGRHVSLFDSWSILGSGRTGCPGRPPRCTPQRTIDLRELRCPLTVANNQWEVSHTLDCYSRHERPVSSIVFFRFQHSSPTRLACARVVVSRTKLEVAPSYLPDYFGAVRRRPTPPGTGPSRHPAPLVPSVY